jgi:sensor c-di-GMP phosphodiesterase-like protein
MEVIAEGIETEEQFEQLRMLGCEYGQGFLFSPPVADHSVLDLLARDAHRDGELDSHFDPGPDEDDVVVPYSM